MLLMASGFSEKQREEVRRALIQAGCDLGCSMGLKKMTIAMTAKKAGVSVGTFYNFFDSKEDFVAALIRDTESAFETEMEALFDKDGNIGLECFLQAFRQNFIPERNILLRFRLEDWVWLKEHIRNTSYFNTQNDKEKIMYLLPKITDIRESADTGVVVNFIKAIYALYQNRDSLFEGSLQTNVDLIFDSIYRYLKA